MKKIFSILGLALAMLTVGCSNDPVEEAALNNTVTLGVNIEDGVRTELGDLVGGQYSILWTKNDRIDVNGKRSSALPTEFIGSTSASFTVSGVAAPYNVVYPSGILNNDGTITVPTVQNYTHGSFDKAAAVMVGHSENDKVSLHNLYSFVKLTIEKGDNVALSNIVISAAGGESISGIFNIDYKTATIEPLAGQDVIRIEGDLAWVENQVVAVVAIPAGKYAAGFKVEINDVNGKSMSKSAYSANGIEVPAGMLLEMPTLEYYSDAAAKVEITTAEQLQAFFDAVNAGDYEAWKNANGEVVLGADIDLTDVTLTSPTTFDGVFNGQGYALTNWQATRGLFIQNTGTVKNVVVDDTCSYTYGAPDGASGDQNVAVIVENNQPTGLVTGCVNSASIEITDVSFGAHRLGGVVGVSYGIVTNCVNHGDISVTSAAVNNGQFYGGVIGYANPNASTKDALGKDIVVNCVNNGNVNIYFPCLPKKVYVGGILGSTQPAASTSATYLGQIKGCINNGEVSYHFETLSSGTYANVGGVVGYAQVNMENCHNYGKVSYTTPTNPANAATRAAAGGVVGCNIFGVKNCNNYGEVFAQGVWAAGTNDAEGAGSQAGSSFGGVVGCTGVYNVMGKTYKVENCNNYGKVTFDIACKTAGGTAGQLAGVVGYSTDEVYNCHNYGEVTLSSFFANTYMAGVAGWVYNTAEISNLTNEGTVNIVAKGVTTTGKSLYAAGVIGRSYTIKECENKGTVNVTVNASTNNIAFDTYYTGGVAGYADTKIYNCTHSGAYSLTTLNTTYSASLRCAGVVGQVKTGTAPFYSIENCHTTKGSTVSLTTCNTKANYVGGVIANCNNGIADCTNKADIDVTISETNTGTGITYIGGITGIHKETVSNCHNEGAITADMNYSTNPLYAATLVASNYTASCVLTGCSNSGSLTIENSESTNLQVGVYGGSNPTTDDGGAVTFENCTNTGAVLVNGYAIQ